MAETLEKSAAAQPPDSGSGDTGRLEGASMGRIIAVLATIVLFSEVVPLQYAMISTATPNIAKSFPSVGENIAWMTIIISLVGGAISPLFGKMADLWGKKKMLLGCSVSFLVGSLICALTDSWAFFLVGRGLQAVAFAMTAIVFSLIRDLMPRKFVPVAIGVSATGLGMSAALAPILGGVLTDHYSWRSLFWFLFIFMLVLIPALIVLVPESKLRVKQKLDAVGSLLLGGAVALLLVYISNGESWGWFKATCIAYAIGGVLMLVGFAFWEKTVDEPFMDLKILTHPRVLVVIAIAFLANIIVGVQTYATTYIAQTPKGEDLKPMLEGSVGQGAAQAQGLPNEAVPQILAQMKQFISFNDPLEYSLGFSLLAMALHFMIWQSLLSMVAGPITGGMAKRYGLRILLAAGMGIMTVSMLMYVFMHGSWVGLLIAGMVYGVAFGMYYAAAPNLMIEAVPQEQQGVSAGMLVVGQAFGAAVGTAIASAILAANKFTMTVAVPGMPKKENEIPQVYTDNAYTTGFWMLVGVGALATVLAFFMKHGRKPATGGLLH
jgi:MFS family permease